VMSLVKSPELTPEKLAANQANARQSQGPATPEGVERIRAANTRHGFYSTAPGAEMHLLGEDKKEFEQSTESVVEAWEPQNDYQEGLVRRMARLMWRLEPSKCVETEEAKGAADGLTIATHPAERDELRAELRDVLRAEVQRVDLEYDVQRSELEVTSAWLDSMAAARHLRAGPKGRK